DLTVSQSHEMAARYVVNVNKIEAGINKSWHPAASTLHDDTSGRGRLYIARTDRGRWIDGDRRKLMAFHHLLDETFSANFALLVRADGVFFRERAGFIGRRMVLS